MPQQMPLWSWLATLVACVAFGFAALNADRSGNTLLATLFTVPCLLSFMLLFEGL